MNINDCWMIFDECESISYGCCGQVLMDNWIFEIVSTAVNYGYLWLAGNEASQPVHWTGCCGGKIITIQTIRIQKIEAFPLPIWCFYLGSLDLGGWWREAAVPLDAGNIEIEIPYKEPVALRETGDAVFFLTMFEIIMHWVLLINQFNLFNVANVLDK